MDEFQHRLVLWNLLSGVQALTVIYEYSKVKLIRWELTRTFDKESDEILYQDRSQRVKLRCHGNSVILRLNLPGGRLLHVFFQNREFSHLAYCTLMAKIEEVLSNLASLIVSNVYILAIIMDFIWEDVDEFLKRSPEALELLQEQASLWKTWSLNKMVHNCKIRLESLPEGTSIPKETKFRLVDLIKEDGVLSIIRMSEAL